MEDAIAKFTSAIQTRFGIQEFTEAYDRGYDAMTDSFLRNPDARIAVHVTAGVFGVRRYLDRLKPGLGRNEAYTDHGQAQVDLEDLLASLPEDEKKFLETGVAWSAEQKLLLSASIIGKLR